MGILRDRIERFLRGETYLHLATMFLIQTILLEIYLKIYGGHTPIYISLIPILVLGLGKELLDKSEGKQISIMDIVGTFIGGLIAILISK